MYILDHPDVTIRVNPDWCNRSSSCPGQAIRDVYVGYPPHWEGGERRRRCCSRDPEMSVRKRYNLRVTEQYKTIQEIRTRIGKKLGHYLHDTRLDDRVPFSGRKLTASTSSK